MNIAETALALWVSFGEIPGTEHGLFPIEDWERLRVSTAGNGILTLEWLMDENDTQTISDIFVLGVDTITTVKGRFVKATSDATDYAVRLWPGNYEVSGDNAMDLWTFDGSTLFPTIEPTNITVSADSVATIIATLVNIISTGGPVTISPTSGETIRLTATGDPGAGVAAIQLLADALIRIQSQDTMIIRSEGQTSVLAKPLLVECDHAAGYDLVLSNLPASAVLAGHVYRDAGGFLKVP